jgi:hypothetical protein
LRRVTRYMAPKAMRRRLLHPPAAKEAVDEPVTAAAYSRPDWMGSPCSI